VELAPDQPESQYELGDVLFHFGPVFDAEDSWDQAAHAFSRALALDSTFSAPLEHLIDVAAVAGDTGRVRSLYALYRQRNPDADHAPYIRWRVANFTGDSLEAAAVRAGFGRLPWGELQVVVQIAQQVGTGLRDVRPVLDVILGKAETPELRRLTLGGIAISALNEGRPLAAAQALRQLHRSDPPDRPHYADHWTVLNALYWGGDTIAAAAAMSVVARNAQAPPAQGPEARAGQLADMCVSELWHVERHGVSPSQRAIALLRAGSGAAAASYLEQLCAALLAVKSATTARRARALDVLDSLVRGRYDAGWTTSALAHASNFELARVREKQGDFAGALGILQRRGYYYWDLMFFSTALRERSRVAALAGNRTTAVHALQQYLALRSDPEPSQQADVEQARGELARLSGETPR
jgi:tetratricopeptide (TPR) repeat protein